MVIGGKFSEGLDFKNNLAWLIFIIGIPYPNYKSSQIQAK